MLTTSRARVAAWAAAAILVVTAGAQLYWGLGGTWGLSAADEASSTAQHVGSVLIGLVAGAGAGVVLARVGYWRGHAPPAIVRLAWTLGFVALGGALAQFSAGGFLAGTINLVVALLAFVVARSDLPAPAAGGAASPPRGLPRPPSPTH